ncbi:MAG: ABC transporter substrate-binding protein [Okeania sp. SIO2C9]|uniref:ABC transporter substrate-binding protein n=1 Tax=Okeania sp. SIO2C9 TaxID=2607791 RepID=UPI0013C06CDB|nr:ABC transporter substrate-binding protein [Okeania sp. SIO2C9]NEQ75222.1 ABC transporter substrate-binding protein [Okeania sp. SIO2C9]
MTKQVVIKIEEGSFEFGFAVSLEFWQDGRIIAIEQNCPQLPANPNFPRIYDEWKEIYIKLGGRGFDFPEAQITNSSILEDCQNVTQTLESNVRNWLGQLAFGAIIGQIIGPLRDGNPNESVRVIIDTSNDYLRKLSWDCWDLFEKSFFLPQAEFALLSQYAKPTEELKKPINILAIFGSDKGGLQLQEDRELIENLKKHGAKITSIPKKGDFLTPQELFDTLWIKKWDILFYAGHSSDKTIHVNNALNLSISVLKEALNRAAPRIKLAIFNSCDGLGIAEYLADFDIPHLIVMRERVPDLVARRFLHFFLEEFTQGKPLHTAVREARKHLQQLEIPIPNELFYPRASRLPVLIQNPATPELYWPSPPPLPEPDRKSIPPIKPWHIISFLLMIIGVSGICRWFYPQPEALEDNISAGEEILVTQSSPRDKQNGVRSVTECQKPLNYFLAIWNGHIRQQWVDCFVTKKSYQLAVENLQKSWQEERRDPETLIYLNNALLAATGVDYYTIAVIVPILEKDAELAQEILRGVAQAQTEVNLSVFNDDKFPNVTLPGSDFLDHKNLNGKGLKVIVANDANSKSQAKKVAETLVKRSDILGIIGHWASEMTMETVDIYNREKLVLVSPGTTTTELTREPRSFFFRTTTSNYVRTGAVVDALNQVNQNRVAIFDNPGSAYSSDYKKRFKEKFLAKGGYIIDSFDISDSNFNAKSTMQQIRNSGEFAIVLIPDGQVSNALVNALKIIKENGGQNWIVGNWSVYSPKTLNIAQPELLEKLILTVPWHPLSNPKSYFSQTTKQLWGGAVSSRTVSTYDATQVLFQGIRQQPTRRGIQKTLADKNFSIDGVTGRIEFIPETGDRQEEYIDLVRVVPCENEVFGLTFLPMKYSTPEAAGLKCSFK